MNWSEFFKWSREKNMVLTILTGLFLTGTFVWLFLFPGDTPLPLGVLFLPFYIIETFIPGFRSSIGYAIGVIIQIVYLYFLVNLVHYILERI